MRCTHPHYALDLGIDSETGKHRLKFVGFRPDLSSYKQLTERYGKDSILALPCGKCLACRINKAKEWAVRCVLESLEHEENYFLTLTYDDAHVPNDGLLYRKDVQDFLKRFRYHFGPVRYFGCGEYGTKNHRPHYHLILFGCNISDLKPIGNGLYESEILKEIWPHGFHYLGFVSYASCVYVAKYSTKKVFGGDYAGEFIMASTNPGIGYNWIKEHLPKVLEYDSVFGPFGDQKVARMPRYFEKIADVLDHQSFVKVKSARIDKQDAICLHEMIQHGIDEVEKLLDYKADILMKDFCSQKQGKRL